MAHPPDEVHPFPPTQWTLVGLAGQTTSEGQRQALGMLLKRYLPALKTYLVLERRLGPDEADEILQEFVSSKVLEQRIVDQADRDRGKFRTFLLRAVTNYLIDRRRYLAAGPRSAGSAEADIHELADVVGDSSPPSDVFDLAWAREVLAEAVKLMRAECEASRRADLWGIFEHRILRPSTEGMPPMEYEELVKLLGLESPAQASNLLMTAKRMFARALRNVVGEYAESGQIEDELRDLKAILAAHRG